MWPVSRSPGSPTVRNATTGEHGVTSASSYRASSRPLRAGRVTDNGFAYISTSARRDARRCHDRRLVQAVGSMPPKASLSSAVVTRNLTSSQEPLVAASHTLAVSSQLAVAIRVPSWLNATPTTQSVWPVRVNSSSPVAASHTLAVAGSSLGEVGVNPEGVLLLDLEDPDRVLRRTSSRFPPRPPPSSGIRRGLSHRARRNQRHAAHLQRSRRRLHGRRQTVAARGVRGAAVILRRRSGLG